MSSQPIEKLAQAELNARFEARRAVRKALEPNHQITIPMRLLNAELTCAVCLGIIRECTSVTMCLHRFCSQCIKDALRLGKKECPQCRVACPSKRNLRPDPVFDEIIASIYPDIEKAEQAQELVVQQILEATNVGKMAHSTIEGMRRQNEIAQEQHVALVRRNSSNRTAAVKRKKVDTKSVAFVLSQHPHLASSVQLSSRFQMSRPKWKADKSSTVEIMRRWLKIKLIENYQPPQSQDASSRSPTSSMDFRDSRFRLYLKVSDMTATAQASLRVRMKQSLQDRTNINGCGLVLPADFNPDNPPKFIEIGGEMALNKLRDMYVDRADTRITLYYDIDNTKSNSSNPIVFSMHNIPKTVASSTTSDAPITYSTPFVQPTSIVSPPITVNQSTSVDQSTSVNQSTSMT